MKKNITTLFTILLFAQSFFSVCFGFYPGIIAPFEAHAATISDLPESATFQEGDIIFQAMSTTQSMAIKLATKSDYTHCGILLKKDGKLQVFEAIRKVSWTPLDVWIKRGVNGHYVLMRLRDSTSLTPHKLEVMTKNAALFAGKDYDLLFEWSDEKIYCSELVWKLYQRHAGIELGSLRLVRDYDLNHEEVQKKALERYGLEIPWEQQVVAPSDIMNCGLLELVEKN